MSSEQLLLFQPTAISEHGRSTCDHYPPQSCQPTLSILRCSYTPNNPYPSPQPGPPTTILPQPILAFLHHPSIPSSRSPRARSPSTRPPSPSEPRSFPSQPPLSLTLPALPQTHTPQASNPTKKAPPVLPGQKPRQLHPHRSGQLLDAGRVRSPLLQPLHQAHQQRQPMTAWAGMVIV